MTDTPKRLCGPLAVPGSAATQYTVPAGTIAIIRSIHVVNVSTTSSAGFYLSIGTMSIPTPGTQLFAGYPVPPNGAIDWSGFIVLNAGEVLQALGSLATLTLTISGVEIT